MPNTEKQFETDIESYLISDDGGWTKASDQGYSTPEGKTRALDLTVLTDFIKETQPLMWNRFVKTCSDSPEEKFYKVFEDSVKMDGMVNVLRHGFKHRGMEFKVCYFKPESELNQTANERYKKNICQCVRQWHYSEFHSNSVDMMLSINGIPVVAIELKNQLTGQSIDDAMKQWMTDRDPSESAFKFNHRILAFFAVDLYRAEVTTRLAKTGTLFLPFNQGSKGAGNDGGAGNPPAPDGDYAVSYLWKTILKKDALMEILQKFISYQEEKKEVYKDGKKDYEIIRKIIFPRYHQWDVVTKLIKDARENGPGHNYLVQHSAGSGKSNSIAWTAYRLASLHNDDNTAVFSSVIIVTDRRVLDSQLQNTIDSFDHTLGSVVLIDEKKSSQHLLQAIKDGKRIIVCTLQKFPVIYDLVGDTSGKAYAVIVDEAHSSQTGQSALKLKGALADLTDALAEYAEIEGKAEEEIDIKNDKMLEELVSAGKHKNLSFFAFTATPKNTTLEIFGTKTNIPGKEYVPFHVYSMHQAIEEGFIMDVLDNYTTYKTCYKLAKTFEEENPEVPAGLAAKAMRRFAESNPVNIQKKSEVIIQTFLDVTAKAIDGKRGKMMVVTSSRLAAVRYTNEIRRQCKMKNLNILTMVAFSGAVKDPDDKDAPDYTESTMNFDKDGNKVLESQTKAVFHDQGDILVVAEKYQTGFDEPLLHTMIIDKKLKDVKAVQTISRLNRIYPGKNDTFVMDFINKTEDIQNAFQKFYTETSLSEEINVDLLYRTQKELREFKVYGDVDVENVTEIYIDPQNTKKDGAIQAKISNALVDVANAYNDLEQQKRYLFRRKIRCFVKWYNYVTQIIRMFDKELHKEYIFCSYLAHLLPSDDIERWDLGNKVTLEYYKLQHTFTGSISLESDTEAIYEPPEIKNPAPKEKKTKSFDDVLEAVNEALKGDFTDGDRVVLRNLWELLVKDPTLRKSAQQDGKQMFINNIFPKKFDDITTQAYLSSQETYSALFEKGTGDEDKYAIFMAKLAAALFSEFTK